MACAVLGAASNHLLWRQSEGEAVAQLQKAMLVSGSNAELRESHEGVRVRVRVCVCECVWQITRTSNLERLHLLLKTAWLKTQSCTEREYVWRKDSGEIEDKKSHISFSITTSFPTKAPQYYQS